MGLRRKLPAVRRAILAAILLVWLVAMGLLLRPQPDQAVEAAAPWADPRTLPSEGASRWFQIYLQGHKVGFVHHSIEAVGNHVRFSETSVLRLNTLGTEQTIRSSAWGTMTGAFELLEMQLAVATGAATFEARVSVEAGELVIGTEPGANSRLLRVPLDGPVFVPLGLRSVLVHQPLEKGRALGGLVFDPLTQTRSRLNLRVIGREPLPEDAQIMAWRVEETWRNVRSVLWVSTDGDLLREEGPMGLVAVAASEEEATQLDEASGDAWDAVAAVSVPVARPIEDPRQRLELRVRLTGIDPEAIPVSEGQVLEGNVLTIKRATIDHAKSYTLPYGGEDHADELGATLGIQKAHPRIRTLARTILGPERGALRATEMLVQWVYQYLAKVPIASLPNALETLDRGSGDCTEHAVLFTALARAAGLPTRLVAGTVYGVDAFLYHAWAEVWLGRWLPVDPALGQVPADATHLKLVEGGLEEQMSLMGLLGKLGIEVIRDTGGPPPS